MQLIYNENILIPLRRSSIFMMWMMNTEYNKKIVFLYDDDITLYAFVDVHLLSRSQLLFIGSMKIALCFDSIYEMREIYKMKWNRLKHKSLSFFFLLLKLVVFPYYLSSTQNERKKNVFSILSTLLMAWLSILRAKKTSFKYTRETYYCVLMWFSMFFLLFSLQKMKSF